MTIANEICRSTFSVVTAATDQKVMLWGCEARDQLAVITGHCMNWVFMCITLCKYCQEWLSASPCKSMIKWMTLIATDWFWSNCIKIYASDLSTVEIFSSKPWTNYVNSLDLQINARSSEISFNCLCNVRLLRTVYYFYRCI